MLRRASSSSTDEDEDLQPAFGNIGDPPDLLDSVMEIARELDLSIKSAMDEVYKLNTQQSQGEMLHAYDEVSEVQMLPDYHCTTVGLAFEPVGHALVSVSQGPDKGPADEPATQAFQYEWAMHDPPWSAAMQFGPLTTSMVSNVPRVEQSLGLFLHDDPLTWSTMQNGAPAETMIRRTQEQPTYYMKEQYLYIRYVELA